VIEPINPRHGDERIHEIGWQRSNVAGNRLAHKKQANVIGKRIAVVIQQMILVRGVNLSQIVNVLQEDIFG
jgi:hypothetical protein